MWCICDHSDWNIDTIPHTFLILSFTLFCCSFRLRLFSLISKSTMAFGTASTGKSTGWLLKLWEMLLVHCFLILWKCGSRPIRILGDFVRQHARLSVWVCLCASVYNVDKLTMTDFHLDKWYINNKLADEYSVQCAYVPFHRLCTRQWCESLSTCSSFIRHFP